MSVGFDRSTCETEGTFALVMMMKDMTSRKSLMNPK